MGHLMELRDVYKIYATGEAAVHALDGVSLTIDEGEFVAIVGQSGSGKSTLMNIMGCLDAPTKGQYRLNDQAVEKMSPSKLSTIRNKQIGFVFQNFHLIGGLDAIENVEVPLAYQGISSTVRHDIAKNSLTRVGLAERLHHRPTEMSGGQQQRVAIARAIAADPAVILADEPTGNLDSCSRSDILTILAQLNQNGKTVVLITHDPTIAESAKRVVKMEDGKILSDLHR